LKDARKRQIAILPDMTSHVEAFVSILGKTCLFELGGYVRLSNKTNASPLSLLRW
jgi:hypothetical protein